MRRSRSSEPMNNLNNPLGAISNLRHRLDMAVRAAQQAQSDLNDARRRAGLPPIPPAFTIKASVDPPELAQPVIAVQPASAAQPQNRDELVEFILRAGAKRRGEIPLDPPRVVAINQRVDNPEETARAILAAAQKARSKT
jgi:hypothetical protein